MPFQPGVGEQLIIDGVTYRVAEHPAAPGIPYGQEGRAGIVYRLDPDAAGGGPRGAVALKVFKTRFRSPSLVGQAEKLTAFSSLPGLLACRRSVLTPTRHGNLLRQHPDLTYAVLMPWIAGPTWQEILVEKRPLTEEQSLAVAQALVQVLATLEQQGVAHCDLSAPNVLLPYLETGAQASGDGRDGVQLVDLEGLYAPGMTRPQELSSGSVGYAHRQATGGLWGPEADRFAGAVLLAEILGWSDPAVTAAAWGESYFDPDEIHRPGDRYRLLLEVLRRRWGSGVASLFEQAWQSETLADCPTFGEWTVALPEKTGPQPAVPFRFRNGREAHDLQELVALCTAAPEDAIWHLDRGDFESWLETLGLTDVARLAARVRQEHRSGPEKLKTFLDGTGVSHGYRPVRLEATAAPSLPPEPPSPTAMNLDELRSRVYAAVSQGQWQEVLNLSNTILSRWPDQSDITLLQMRARRLVEMDREVETAWLRAMQTHRVEDWEACWQAAQMILQHSPRTPRYQEIADQAQQEMEWAAVAARAEALVAQQQLDEAEGLLTILPANHVLAAPIRARIEVARSRQRRVEALLEQAQQHIREEAWDQAIVTCQMGLALAGSHDRFHALLEQAYREREVEGQVTALCKRAEHAAEAGQWDEAVRFLDEALTLRPGREALRVYRDRVVRYAEATRRLTQYDWAQAEALLADVPDDFLDVVTLRKRVQQERERWEKLQTAKRVYDGEAVLLLLEDVRPDYPGLDAWRAWANREIDRRRKLEAARALYDGEAVLALLADVGPEYPDLDVWQAWANNEIDRRRRLEAARQTYDAEAVLALLSDVGENYPDLVKWQAWAESEIQRQQRLQAAREAYDGETVLALLADVGPGYPDLAGWEKWAKSEIERRRQLETARKAYDGETVLALLADVTPHYPELDSWRTWAQGEVERQHSLQLAKQAYDVEWVLALLADVGPDYPNLAGWRAWAEGEVERRRRLEAAKRAYDGEAVLALLADVGPDYPDLAGWRAWAESEIKRRDKLEAAEQAYDGEAVLALLADVGSDYPNLAGWRAWAEGEVERRHRLEAAKRAYDGEAVLALLADVGPDYPDLADWRAWAEGEIERQRRLEAAKRAYDGEAVLALLADVGPDYPDLAGWRVWAEGEIERRHKLEAAKQAYDGETVLALLADVEPNYPELDTWRAWAEAQIVHQRNLLAAKRTYDVERVLALLAETGPDYVDLNAWKSWAEDEIERRRKLQAAKQAYDGEAALALLADVGPDYPNLTAWRAWAEREIERRRGLEAARRAYDGNAVLTLLADVGPDYPDFNVWQAWAEEKLDLRHRLEAAQAAYDGEAVLALLNAIGPDYPDFEMWQTWAEREIGRQRALQAALAAYDGEAVLVLLKDVGSNYPGLAGWQAWAQDEITRRHQLEEAKRAYNGEAVLALLADVGPDYPDLDTWRSWAQTEIERRHRLDAAKRAYDGEAVLALLADVGPDYPDLADWQAWAEAWAEHRRLLTQAQQEQRWRDVLQTLQALPSDYPDRERLLAEAEHGLWQQEHLEQAQAEFAAGRWQEVIAHCDRVIAEGGDPVLFEPLRERARQEQMTDREVARLTEQAETCVQAGALGEAVTLLEQALNLRPKRAELTQRLGEVRHAWEREQAIEQAQRAFSEKQWDDVLRLVEQWTAEDPRAADLARNARDELIAELYQQAEIGEQEGHWKAALAALQRLQTLSVDDNLLPGRIEQAQREVEAAQALDRARKACDRKHWKEALAEVNYALTLFPNRTEALSMRQEVEQVLERQRARRLRLLVGLGGALAVLLLVGGLGAWWRGSSGGGSITPTTTLSVAAIAATQTPTTTVRGEGINLTATTQAEATATAKAKLTDEARSGAMAITDTPTPRPTNTPTPRPTNTPTPTPTDTPTPRPANTPTPRPTNTPTPRPTDTPTRRATPTPTSLGALSAPTLVSPDDNASVSGQVTFSWRWDGPPLTTNQAFEVRLWKDGQPEHYGAAEPTQETTVTIDLAGTYGVSQGGPGNYYWTVAVVERNPYRRVGPEAVPRRLQVTGGAQSPATPTPVPPSLLETSSEKDGDLVLSSTLAAIAVLMALAVAHPDYRSGRFKRRLR